MTQMMKQYMEIKSEYPDTLMFFQMGDFFELFNDDAIVAAPIMEIALTKKGEHPMCGVPIRSYELYLSKLLNKGLKVAICEQKDEKTSSKLIKREVVRVITPGTLVEESLLKWKYHNFIVSISKNFDDSFSVVTADISTGFIEISQERDIYDFLYNTDPSEIIVSDDFVKSLKILDQSFKKKLTMLPKIKFNNKNAIEKIKSIYSLQTLDVFESLSCSECESFGALIDYLEITNKKSLKALLWPKIKREKKKLVIDASTKKNLELIHTNSLEKEGSLINHIDYTSTAFGGRLLLAKLLEPSNDLSVINNDLDEVEKLVKDQNYLNSIRKTLKHCPDAERAISRLSMGKLSPRDLSYIKSLLITQNELKLNIVDTTLLKILSEALKEETLPINFELDIIKEGYEHNLDNLRSLHQTSKESIERLQDKYTLDTSINNLKIKYNNIIGYYIEIPLSNISKIKDYFIHRQTISGKARYTTKELIETSKSLEDFEWKLFKLERDIFENLVTYTCNYEKEIRELCSYIAKIDVAASFATIALKFNYTRPIIDNTTNLTIKNGRHPILDNENFISNDCIFDEESRFFVMTGPNMAGKSTYLRQNALILIMAHMGSFVPASFAKIGIVDRIFSRIGASDHISSGKSTFMVEMIETAIILRNATDRSFVILDEVGRGTSTFDGLAIAYAVSEELITKISCKTLFATHYFELSKICEHYKKAKPITMSIKEWNDGIVFLHKVISGSAEKSYGIHVAKLAGIPESVINRSNALLNQFEAA